MGVLCIACYVLAADSTGAKATPSKVCAPKSKGKPISMETSSAINDKGSPTRAESRAESDVDSKSNDRQSSSGTESGEVLVWFLLVYLQSSREVINVSFHIASIVEQLGPRVCFFHRDVIAFYSCIQTSLFISHSDRNMELILEEAHFSWKPDFRTLHSLDFMTFLNDLPKSKLWLFYSYFFRKEQVKMSDAENVQYAWRTCF